MGVLLKSEGKYEYAESILQTFRKKIFLTYFFLNSCPKFLHFFKCQAIPWILNGHFTLEIMPVKSRQIWPDSVNRIQGAP